MIDVQVQETLRLLEDGLVESLSDEELKKIRDLVCNELNKRQFLNSTSMCEIFVVKSTGNNDFLFHETESPKASIPRDGILEGFGVMADRSWGVCLGSDNPDGSEVCTLSIYRNGKVVHTRKLKDDEGSFADTNLSIPFKAGDVLTIRAKNARKARFTKLEAQIEFTFT